MNVDRLTTDSLVATAKSKCKGCEISWRLDGWKHREPMPIECCAKPERQQLRAIAMKLKVQNE